MADINKLKKVLGGGDMKSHARLAFIDGNMRMGYVDVDGNFQLGTESLSKVEPIEVDDRTDTKIEDTSRPDMGDSFFNLDMPYIKWEFDKPTPVKTTLPKESIIQHPTREETEYEIASIKAQVTKDNYNRMFINPPPILKSRHRASSSIDGYMNEYIVNANSSNNGWGFSGSSSKSRRMVYKNTMNNDLDLNIKHTFKTYIPHLKPYCIGNFRELDIVVLSLIPNSPERSLCKIIELSENSNIIKILAIDNFSYTFLNKNSLDIDSSKIKYKVWEIPVKQLEINLVDHISITQSKTSRYMQHNKFFVFAKLLNYEKSGKMLGFISKKKDLVRRGNENGEVFFIHAEDPEYVCKKTMSKEHIVVIRSGKAEYRFLLEDIQMCEVDTKGYATTKFKILAVGAAVRCKNDRSLSHIKRGDIAIVTSIDNKSVFSSDSRNKIITVSYQGKSIRSRFKNFRLI